MTPFVRLVVVCACVCVCAQAQYAEERAPRYIASEPKAPATTPVPILKQINRHNEDGSYTYGYEAADGSFKIETKAPSGEVKGKYGYRDDTGKVRVVEYGANKFGFQPAGEGITVAPPTLVDETAKEDQRQNKGNRNQYRQQQQPDYDYEDPAPAPPPRPAPRPQPQQQYRAPQPQQQQYRSPQPQQQYRPAPQPQQEYRPAPQPQQQYRPAPQPQQQYRPAQQSAPTPPKPQFFSGAAPAPAQDNFFNPEPAPRQYKPKQQDFRPTPQVQDYQSFAPAPSPEPRFPPNFQQPRNTQTFSMLDQLLKEYSLPSGGANPLHDITFGSY